MISVDIDALRASGRRVLPIASNHYPNVKEGDVREGDGGTYVAVMYPPEDEKDPTAGMWWVFVDGTPTFTHTHDPWCEGGHGMSEDAMSTDFDALVDTLCPAMTSFFEGATSTNAVRILEQDTDGSVYWLPAGFYQPHFKGIANPDDWALANALQTLFAQKEMYMGLSSERSYRIQKHGKDRLSYIWLNAITFYYTWENIGNQVQEVMSSPDMKKAPTYVHSYLQGYWDAKREDIWHHTMWMLWCDNKLMTSREVDELTKLEAAGGEDKTPGYNSPWSRIDSDLSRHVWLDSRTGLPLPDKSLDDKWRH